MARLIDQLYGNKNAETPVKHVFENKIQKSETFDTTLEKLNENFNKGFITEDRYEKALGELDGLIEKAFQHKYIRREGSPGSYKYIYRESEIKHKDKKVELDESHQNTDINNVYKYLSQISGIGKEKAKVILAYMGSVSEMKKMSGDSLKRALVKIPGVSLSTAEKVVHYFKEYKKDEKLGENGKESDRKQEDDKDFTIKHETRSYKDNPNAKWVRVTYEKDGQTLISGQAIDKYGSEEKAIEAAKKYIQEDLKQSKQSGKKEESKQQNKGENKKSTENIIKQIDSVRDEYNKRDSKMSQKEYKEQTEPLVQELNKRIVDKYKSEATLGKIEYADSEEQVVKFKLPESLKNEDKLKYYLNQSRDSEIENHIKHAEGSLKVLIDFYKDNPKFKQTEEDFLRLMKIRKEFPNSRILFK